MTPFTTDVLRERTAVIREKHGLKTIKHGPRHCFASYWLARHGEINGLCLALGHHDPETTFKHYAKVATKRDAEKYWGITPKGAGDAKILQMKELFDSRRRSERAQLALLRGFG